MKNPIEETYFEVNRFLHKSKEADRFEFSASSFLRGVNCNYSFSNFFTVFFPSEEIRAMYIPVFKEPRFN